MGFVHNEKIDSFLKCLANENRRNIMALFFDGKPKTVNEVAEKGGVSQSTASEYLKQLKQSGLLYSERDGKEVMYRPDTAGIKTVLKELVRYLDRCC